MSSNELLAIIRKRPFEPFRMHLSDGTTYDIHHPEMVMPGMSIAIIGLPARPGEEFFARTETVSLRHVVKIVPLQTPVAE
jgi:hypothetical protein